MQPNRRETATSAATPANYTGPDGDPARRDPNGSQPIWRRALGPLLLAVVIAFAVIALRRNWTEVRSKLELLSAGDLAASAIAVTAASFSAWFVWHLLLLRLGAVLRRHPSQVIFFSAQVGKYAPGSVWPALIATQLGRANGVRRSTVLSAYVLVIVVTVATAGLLGPMLLLRRTDATIVALCTTAAVGGVVLLVAAGHPGGLDRFTRWVSRRTGRELPATNVPPSQLTPIVLGQLLTWCLFGVHVWVLARPLGAGWDDLLPTIAAFALAFAAGLLVFPLPAGAGVREAVLLIALKPAIGSAGALSVALLSRFVIIVVELAIALLIGVPHAIRTVRDRGRDVHTA